MALIICACSDATTETTTTNSESTSTSMAAGSTTTSPPVATSTPARTADVVYLNGTVHTQDDSLGTVQALAISGDEIVAVGSDDDISALVGDGTVVVDLQGRTVIPGFVDSHTHILTDTGSVAAGQPQALAAGITTIGEAFINQERLDALVDSSTRGELELRTNLYLVRTDNCGNDLGRWYEDYPPGEFLAERVRVAGVKVFADGGTCGPFAATEPFIEGLAVGTLFNTDEKMEEFIRDADTAGYQVLVHAIGDLAIGQVLDAYETVLGPGGARKLNHRIDHNSFQTPELLGRYDEVGVSGALPGWLRTCDIAPTWTEFWFEYGDDPNRSIDSNPNTTFGWHGDDPWIGPVAPLWEMFNLVTVAEYRDGEICEPPPRVAARALTRQQVFDMMTTGSAYLLNQSELVGSLTPGKYADLVVLSDDLLTVPPEQLLEIRVEVTIIGGEVLHCVGDICSQIFGSTAEGPPGSGECVTPPQGVIHWWTGDEDAGDSTGGIDGAGATVAPGLVGNALVSSGSGIALSGQPDLADGFTIEGWVLFDSPIAQWSTIFNNNQVFIRKNGPEEGDALAVFVKTADGEVEPRAQTSTAIEGETWYHFAATWDGSVLGMHLDGREEGSGDRPGPLTNATVEARIGAGEQESIDANPMFGMVDELTIYDRALDASEIASIVAAGPDGKCR